MHTCMYVILTSTFAFNANCMHYYLTTYQSVVCYVVTYVVETAVPPY